MKVAQLGDDVIYVHTSGTAEGEKRSERAAKVVKVWGEDASLNLTVFREFDSDSLGSREVGPLVLMASVPYNEKGDTDHTWHFKPDPIERFEVYVAGGDVYYGREKIIDGARGWWNPDTDKFTFNREAVANLAPNAVPEYPSDIGGDGQGGGRVMCGEELLHQFAGMLGRVNSKEPFRRLVQRLREVEEGEPISSQPMLRQTVSPDSSVPMWGWPGQARDSRGDRVPTLEPLIHAILSGRY